MAGPRISFIGIGNMGRGMTKNLVEKGTFSKPLILYNRTTKTAEDWSREIGSSEVVTTVEDAVTKSDIIFIALGTDDIVMSTIEKAVKPDVKGKIFVDCSTIHPDTTAMITKVVEAHGADFVACPQFGTTDVARAGGLISVFAGKEAAVKKVIPFGKGVFGKANIDFSGDPPSKATKLKLTGNTFILSMVASLAEGHVMAEKTGLGMDGLHQFIDAFYGGPFAAYSKRMITGDYYTREQPAFGADLARKDARHAMKLSSEAGVEMKIAQLADGYLAQVQEHMGSRGDIAGMYGSKREQSGLKFENQE